jgi:hypothetical protein
LLKSSQRKNKNISDHHFGEESRKQGTDTHEPTGEPESLWVRIDPKHFGDRVAHDRPPELNKINAAKKKKKERERDPMMSVLRLSLKRMKMMRMMRVISMLCRKMKRRRMILLKLMVLVVCKWVVLMMRIWRMLMKG